MPQPPSNHSTIAPTNHNGSILHVRSPFGAKATEVGGSPPKAIAELLLSEIVSDREGEGEIA
jgi:hypothetical protein